MTKTNDFEPVFQRPLSGDAIVHWPSAQVPSRATLAGDSVQLEPLDADKHADDLYEASHSTEQGLRIWDYLTTGPWPTVEAYREGVAFTDRKS